MAYVTKYRLHLNAADGTPWYADILGKDFVGPMQERVLGASGLQLVKDADGFFTGTSLEISIQVEEGETFGLLDLYSDDPRANFVKLYRDTQLFPTLEFAGYLQPEVYSDPYVAPPFDINVTAMDGLGMLKTSDFALAGTESEMAIVAHCLANLDLGFSIGVGIHVFENGMSTSQSPLGQSYLDCSIFIGSDGDVDDCHTVLQKIFSSYGVSSDINLTQYRGRWYISRNIDSDKTFHLYNTNGVSTGSTASAFGTKILGSESNGADVYPIGSLHREMQSPLQKLTIEQDYGLKLSVLDGWDCANSANYDDSYNGIHWKPQTSISEDDINVRRTTVIGREGKVTVYDTMRISNGTGWAYNIVNLEADEVDYCLELNYKITWSASNGGIVLPDSFHSAVMIKNGAKSLGPQGWQDDAYEFPLDATQSNLDTTKKIYFNNISTGSISVLLKAIPTSTAGSGNCYFKSIKLSPDTESHSYPSGKETTVLLNAKTSATDSINIIGDMPELPNREKVYSKAKRIGSTYGDYSSAWKHRSDTQSYLLSEIVARAAASNNRKGLQILSGTITGDFNLVGIIQHPLNENRKFIICSGTYNIFEHEYNVELRELLPYQETSYDYENKEVLSSGNASTTINTDKDYVVYGVGQGIGVRLFSLATASDVSSKFLLVDSSDQSSAQKVSAALLGVLTVNGDVLNTAKKLIIDNYVQAEDYLASNGGSLITQSDAKVLIANSTINTGGVGLYHNKIERLTTLSDGVNVIGNIIASANVSAVMGLYSSYVNASGGFLLPKTYGSTDYIYQILTTTYGTQTIFRNIALSTAIKFDVDNSGGSGWFSNMLSAKSKLELVNRVVTEDDYRYGANQYGITLNQTGSNTGDNYYKVCDWVGTGDYQSKTMKLHVTARTDNGVVVDAYLTIGFETAATKGGEIGNVFANYYGNYKTNGRFYYTKIGNTLTLYFKSNSTWRSYKGKIIHIYDYPTNWYSANEFTSVVPSGIIEVDNHTTRDAQYHLGNQYSRSLYGLNTSDNRTFALLKDSGGGAGQLVLYGSDSNLNVSLNENYNTFTKSVAIGKTSSPGATLDVNGDGIFNGANNTAPSNEAIKVNKYGLLGNRGAVYITNAQVNSTLVFGIGSVHGQAGTIVMRLTGPNNEARAELRQTFTSGFEGRGTRWSDDGTDGGTTFEVDNLVVRDNMHVSELEINKIRATNGSLWVSDVMESTNIGIVNNPFGNTQYVITGNKDTDIVFVIGDIIRCQKWDKSNNSIVKVEGTVINSTITNSTPVITIEDTKDISTGFTVLNGRGTFVRVNYDGTIYPERKGLLYLSSSDSGSPYLNVIYDSATKIRLGNLSGISNQSGYGLWVADPFGLEALAFSSDGYARMFSWDINTYRLSKVLGGTRLSLGASHIDESLQGLSISYNNDINNHISMVTDASDVYLIGKKGGKEHFRLTTGDSSQISGFEFNDEQLFKTLTKNKITLGKGNLDTSTTGIEIGVDINNRISLYSSTSGDGMGLICKKTSNTIFHLTSTGTSNIANWNFNDTTLFYDGTPSGTIGRHTIGIQSSIGQSTFGPRQGQGFGFYRDDSSLIKTNSVKSLHIGQIPNSLTSYGFSSTDPKYGLDIRAGSSGSKLLMRCDEDGSYIAGFQFDNEKLWTDNMKIDSAKGKVTLFSVPGASASASTSLDFVGQSYIDAQIRYIYSTSGTNNLSLTSSYDLQLNGTRNIWMFGSKVSFFNDEFYVQSPLTEISGATIELTPSDEITLKTSTNNANAVINILSDTINIGGQGDSDSSLAYINCGIKKNMRGVSSTSTVLNVAVASLFRVSTTGTFTVRNCVDGAMFTVINTTSSDIYLNNGDINDPFTTTTVYAKSACTMVAYNTKLYRVK